MPSSFKKPKTKNEIFLDGIKSRNAAVINQIYVEYFPKIHSFVRRNSGNLKDAEDLFHDGLLVVYEKVRNPDFVSTSSLFTFLYAICNRLWLKKLNRKSIHRRVTNEHSKELSYNDTPDDTMEKEDKFDLYREKFSLLSPSCQRLLGMFFQGKSMEDIAKDLEYGSEGYARKKKFKCKEKLIEMIKADPRFNEFKD